MKDGLKLFFDFIYKVIFYLLVHSSLLCMTISTINLGLGSVAKIPVSNKIDPTWKIMN